MSDTIAAVATGSTVSAIGILRLSGDRCIEVADALFTPFSGRRMSAYEDRRLVFGELRDKKGSLLDVCLCTLSHAPNSYTGEDTVELQCHGSPVTLRLALQAAFDCGARQAAAGEFSKRAFLNGRMDLTQAEAVIDLIESETAEAARNAAGQLGGAVLRKADGIYNSLVDINSHFQAVLDYPDEDIPDFEMSEYAETIENAIVQLQKLLDSFESGEVLKKGVKVAIVGRPNVGKSSVLNTLLGFERAIVTDIPGTTRDTIEDTVKLGGVLLRLCDTAGIREATDSIEKMGVERSRQAAGEAQLIIAVFDGSHELTAEDRSAIMLAADARHAIAVINKTDLDRKICASDISESFDKVVEVSAKQGRGFDRLGEAIAELYPASDAPAGEIITNARQAEAISRALDLLNAANVSVRQKQTPDIVLTQVEDALEAVGGLSGKNLQDDVTQAIFGRFCVGK